MLKIAEEKAVFKLDGDSILCSSKSGVLDNETVLILAELKKYKKNTLHLLKSRSLNPAAYEIAIDIETTSLRPSEGDIRLVSMFGSTDEYVGDLVAEVASILANPSIKKIFHNAAFDVTWLLNKGFQVVNYTDTMVMSQILNNSAKSNNTLQYLAMKHLSIHLDKSLQTDTNWQGEISDAHKRYALKDAEVTFKLYQLFKEMISESHLDVVLDREMAAMPALIELNSNGIPFDYAGWTSVLVQLEIEAKDLEKEIRFLVGNDHLNLSSPKQLCDAFEKQGLILDSTSDESLAKYEENHKAIIPLRHYKRIKKQLTSYGEKLKQQLSDDGRLRGNWRLIGTDTSRMTCKQPNLQGLPTVSKPYVKASVGKVFVMADYSTIELRVLAQLTKDTELLKAFQEGEDLHEKTARAIFDKGAVATVTEDERKVGKVINFGLVYGMTKYGLRKKVQAATGNPITLEQAELFRTRYFDLYPGVLKFQNQMLKSEHIETLGGRYWSPKTTELKRGAISRYNYPVQGSAAEGFKNALALLSESKPPEWQLLAAVHDEILLEVPEEDANEASEWLVMIMKQGMAQLIPTIQIEVEYKVSSNWSK